MAAHPPVSAMEWRRHPPAGFALRRGALARAARESNAAEALAHELARRLGAGSVVLFSSGRAALRVALEHAANVTGRREVLIPAYACYSVPAAAVAAGLRVRLVDVTIEGKVCPTALARHPIERACALVVCNLFGVAEPIAGLHDAMRDAGTLLIDDAAQSFGATDPSGLAGARGELGVLSFGRGKPLTGLGGGGFVDMRATWQGTAPAVSASSSARLRFLTYRIASHPVVFRWLAALPGLGIGETRFDPTFAVAGIDSASAVLALASLWGSELETGARASRARAMSERIANETTFAPIGSPPGAGVYPRLALLAPTPSARDAALHSLRPVGAGTLYPSSLDDVEPLRRFRTDDSEQPTARRLAARLMTLPTHYTMNEATLDRVVVALRAAQEARTS